MLYIPPRCLGICTPLCIMCCQHDGSAAFEIEGPIVRPDSGPQADADVVRSMAQLGFLLQPHAGISGLSLGTEQAYIGSDVTT